MTYVCSIDTPLGTATAAANGDSLTGFWFVGQKYYPKNTFGWIHFTEHPVFETLRNWLIDYFEGKNPTENLTPSGCHPIMLNPQGTPFQKAVWEILLRVPYGHVTTYGTVAEQYAEKACLPSMSAQAVGGAVGSNPISLLIPCHRVVGANGSLTGYAGGIEKKRALLALEQS